jgi:hypothetical protein
MNDHHTPAMRGVVKPGAQLRQLPPQPVHGYSIGTADAELEAEVGVTSSGL